MKVHSHKSTEAERIPCPILEAYGDKYSKTIHCDVNIARNLIPSIFGAKLPCCDKEKGACLLAGAGVRIIEDRAIRSKITYPTIKVKLHYYWYFATRGLSYTSRTFLNVLRNSFQKKEEARDENSNEAARQGIPSSAL